MKLTLKAILESVRTSKTDPKKIYADFLFLGGSASFLVDPSEVGFYQSKQGTEIEISVSVRPRSVVIFERPVVMFEPLSLIPVKH